MISHVPFFGESFPDGWSPLARELVTVLLAENDHDSTIHQAMEVITTWITTTDGDVAASVAVELCQLAGLLVAALFGIWGPDRADTRVQFQRAMLLAAAGSTP